KNILKNDFFIVIVCCILKLHHIYAAIGDFECKQDAAGAEWTVQYKVKDNVDSYIITNTAAADWRDIAINNANSPMVLTLDQYFKAAADKVDAAIIAYNNLPPGAVRPNAESTAKDFNIADASLLLDNLIEKAALFMCLTIDYKNTAWGKEMNVDIFRFSNLSTLF
ncbi:conserved hypothetical protein, partial [Trichinella spiralis]|uniref:hypothetical protein n=1 Tax=Trichinella spiralis TaxID=6334 RepID=UPI0001EFE297